MEQRREAVRKPEVSLEEKLAEAEDRRRVQEEEKLKKLNELCGHDKKEKVTVQNLMENQFRTKICRLIDGPSKTNATQCNAF